ncbi:hypothetical protein RHSIM_Rhsim05G0173100 [Rhododendron simsii]|uniref:Uncharacterized protein n=1 Tax=Rhododendron simsii TaxID=118357 RepID=A0A834LPW5_RHOSS|nr:hypothetical protein RHSIM_Rhsim05G0173100 [Rhododendron simsii]
MVNVEICYWAAGFWASPLYHLVPLDIRVRIGSSRSVPSCSPEYLLWIRSVSHPRVGCGEAPVWGRAREEEVLAVLEVVNRVVGDSGLGAVELHAALQEVQAILRPKIVIFRKQGVGASGRE